MSLLNLSTFHLPLLSCDKPSRFGHGLAKALIRPRLARKADAPTRVRALLDGRNAAAAAQMMPEGLGG
jgi:hypothetical protein